LIEITTAVQTTSEESGVNSATNKVKETNQIAERPSIQPTLNEISK